MTDSKLEAALYSNRGTKQGHRRHAEPDWPAIHRELKRKHVTLLIIGDEYIAVNPGGYRQLLTSSFRAELELGRSWRS
jgi:transposase